MPPSATATKGDLKDLLGVTMEDVTDGEVLRTNRGRREGDDVIALRAILLDSMKSNKAKAFHGVKNVKQKDEIVRKIRSAAKTAGPSGKPVKVGTSFDAEKETLYWGPQTVIDSLTGKTASE